MLPALYDGVPFSLAKPEGVPDAKKGWDTTQIMGNCMNKTENETETWVT